MTPGDRKWRDIFASLAQEPIEQRLPDMRVTNAEFIHDLHTLEHFFPEKHLNGTGGVIEIRNAVMWILKEPRSSQRLVYLYHLRHLAALVRAVKQLPGSARLLAKLYTDRGFINQLKATLWLGRFLPIHDIELVEGNQDIDILSTLPEKRLKVHVKTVDQADKELLQFLAVGHVSELLRRETAESAEDSLTLTSFLGVVPNGVGEDRWRDLLKSVPRKPGKYDIQIDANHAVTVELGCGQRGKMTGVNPLRNLGTHIEHVRRQIIPNAGDINLLLAVTAHSATLQTIRLKQRQYLLANQIDIVVFVAFARTIDGQVLFCDRSSFLSTESASTQGDFLGKAVPANAKIELPVR